jgi:serine/threonine protein kinase
MKICPQCQSSYPDDYQVCPRDQKPLQVQPEIEIGTVIRGKYEVLGKLGSGGMATVYEVRHLAFQQVAALKVVHRELLADPDFMKRFRNEAVVAWQLKHPNAVRIDDLDYTEDGRPYIVMEYIQGISLQDAGKRQPGPWPADLCFTIAGQVARALGAAHELGIVHRDIKPSNILLTTGPDGHGLVKVLDFGIAKTIGNAFAGMTAVKTSANMIIGTPEYMSPEQASGDDESQIDGRSDLYALGMVLYQMLAGVHPFRADTPMGMLVHQIHTEPVLPPMQPEVPEATSALILKALRKKPEDRFQTAAEMLQALQDPEGWWRAQRGLPPQAGASAPEPLPAPEIQPESQPESQPEIREAVAPAPQPAAAPSVRELEAPRMLPSLATFKLERLPSPISRKLVAPVPEPPPSLVVRAEIDAEPQASAGPITPRPAKAARPARPAPHLDPRAAERRYEPEVLRPQEAPPRRRGFLLPAFTVVVLAVLLWLGITRATEWRDAKPSSGAAKPGATSSQWAELRLSCDMNCVWTTDNGSTGTIQAQRTGKLLLPSGSHKIVVSTADGKASKVLDLVLQPGSTTIPVRLAGLRKH